MFSFVDALSCFVTFAEAAAVMSATRAAAAAAEVSSALGPKAGQMVDDDLFKPTADHGGPPSQMVDDPVPVAPAKQTAACGPPGEMVDDPVPAAPAHCLGFEGKMIKRLCGQGYLFASLKPGWERTVLWFESGDMCNQRVKEMIRAIQYGEVYSFKDVVDFTPFVHTGKSNVAS